MDKEMIRPSETSTLLLEYVDIAAFCHHFAKGKERDFSGEKNSSRISSWVFLSNADFFSRRKGFTSQNQIMKEKKPHLCSTSIDE